MSVEFDGVYRDATVYLNGHKLGTHPYGYTSFTFDLTPDLNFTGPNVLAVRVDNSAQPNSRWYSGSGIYRHVRVVVTDPTHVAHWGVFVTTPKVSDESATVAIQTNVENDSAKSTGVTVETTLYDRAGHEAGKTQSTLDHCSGERNGSRANDRGRQPCFVVACFAHLVPCGLPDTQRWQSCGSGGDAVRNPVTLVVGGEGAASEWKAGQARRRKRSS